MINIRNLSEENKNLIKEIWPIIKLKNVGLLSDFLYNKGFHKSIGSFKSCFFKDNIVVKFPSRAALETEKECLREYEQWMAVPKSMRKYFPKMYAFKNNVLIQEAIQKCNAGFCQEAEDFHKKFWPVFWDLHHNHGHKNGQIKFFDWVYHRSSEYLGNIDARLPTIRVRDYLTKAEK